MRDLRMFLVLLVSIGIIVAGATAVPMLFNAVPSTVEQVTAAAVAAESAKTAEPAVPPADVDRLSEAFREAAKRVMPAVVSVSTSQTVTAPVSPFGELPDDFLRRFFGTEPDQAARPPAAAPRASSRGRASGPASSSTPRATSSPTTTSSMTPTRSPSTSPTAAN